MLHEALNKAGSDGVPLNTITDWRWWPVPKGDGPPFYVCSKLGPSDREYCLIDRFEACTVDAVCPYASGAPCALPAQLSLSSFANCLEATHGCDSIDAAAPCAKSAGLDAVTVAAIQKCAAGDGAAAVMNHIYGVANASTPVVTGFPDIRIDSKTTPHAFPSFVEELERAICVAYTGTHPKACGPYFERAAAAAAM